MSPAKQRGSWVVFLSTFPPTECGIATFTQDLVATFDTLYAPRDRARVFAVTYDRETDHRSDGRVLYQVHKDEGGAYAEAARKLNALTEVKLVSIQHEFGLFAGPYGERVLDFLTTLEKPSVVTFHTVLPEPDLARRRCVRAIARATCGCVVMTETSKRILVREYGITSSRITVIPHGIQAMPYMSSARAKAGMKKTSGNVLTTFGLLSPGKGIEYVIEAMPSIVERHPDTVYQILGATHPQVIRSDGESYRRYLEDRVRALGLSEHVQFHNAYMSKSELLRYLKATDVYIATPLDPDQAVSGTLSYALGTGRPVVATRFAQAQEDVTYDVGRLVGFRSPEEIAAAVSELLDDSQICRDLGRNAYFRTRSMTWENVLLRYRRLFGSCAPNQFHEESNLPRLTLKHLHRMTGRSGLYQFALLTKPDPRSGYTLDDNARALVACVWWSKYRRDGASHSLIERYLDMLAYMMQQDGFFHNYVNHDMTSPIERNKEENLEDANARGFWALATLAGADWMPRTFREKAAGLFDASIDIHGVVRSPRAVSFYIKALGEWLRYRPDDEARRGLLASFSEHLLSLFARTQDDGWNWCEPHLTYSNGVIPEALLVAGEMLGSDRSMECGKKALDFLIEHSFEGRVCVPVGQSGWFVRGGEKRRYDQQPEEVSALVQALDRAYAVFGEETYRTRKLDAFNWFLGNNLLDRFIYDHTTGGCYDGLGEGYVNLNQGAESTVSYLMARLLCDSPHKGSRRGVIQ